MLINLTPEEYIRFALWLEQEADTSNRLAEQCKKLGAAGNIIAEHEENTAKAAQLIARKLRSTQFSGLKG